MSERLIISLLVLLLAAVPASASDQANAFVDFAFERCIGPMERGEEPTREGMKLSARSVALIPGLSNTALAYETQDGLYFISIDLGEKFKRCTVGLRHPNLRRIADEHAVVISRINEIIVGWQTDRRYTLADQRLDDPRLEIDLLSTDWRQPRMKIGFFSDPELGRLHLFVQDVTEAPKDEETE